MTTDPFVIGEMGDADWRVPMLRKLVDDGVITYDEMFDVIDWTNPNDTKEKIYGVVAGEFNLTGREISKSLVGTQWKTSAKDIDIQKKGYSEWIENLKDNAVTAAGWTLPGMYNKAARLGSEMLAGGVSNIFDSIQTQEEYEAGQADRDRLARDQEKMLEIIEKAEGDYITPATASEYRMRVKSVGKSGVLYGNTDPLSGVDDMYSILDDLNDLGFTTSLIGELESQTSEQVAQQDALSATAPPRLLGPEDKAEAIRMYGENQARVAAESANTNLDFGTLTYAGTMEALGEFENQLSKLDPEQLAASGYDLGVEGDIIDRVSGRALTKQQYSILKKNDLARAAYKRTRPTSSSMQQILDSGVFFGEGVSNKNTTNRNGRIPIENIEIPTLFPEKSWERDPYLYGGAAESRAELIGMSTRERERVMLSMSRALMLPDQPVDLMNFVSPFNEEVETQWDIAKTLSEAWQMEPLDVIAGIGRANRSEEAAARRQYRGSGAAKPKYSVPASLRSIPDYKTLAQETKGVFSQELGRDMEDWELALLADELKNNYATENAQLRAINREAWDDAVAGGSGEVDLTAVEDPTAALQFDIQESYSNELDRKERVVDRANNRRLLMDSLSIGERMIG